MSETPKPPITDLGIRDESGLGGRSPFESKEASKTPENRALQLAGFNFLFKKYEEKMAPLWGRLESGEDLSDQERKDAIGYKITLDGIERLTAEPHITNEPALPDGLPTDEFVNTYHTPDGRVKKQREGLVTNHMTQWAQREIDGGNRDPRIKLARQVVWENSLPYSQLHSTPNSISLEDRIRQEAGAYIHDTGEGNDGRDSSGRKIRDSKHPSGSKEHELDDWMSAEKELGGREEYVIDPPLPTDSIKFVNPPRFEFDPDIEPRKVYIPDRDESGPVIPGRVKERRSDEEIREWTVDLGGGVKSVGRVDVEIDYREPAKRNIGEANDVQAMSGESSDNAKLPDKALAGEREPFEADLNVLKTPGTDGGVLVEPPKKLSLDIDEGEIVKRIPTTGAPIREIPEWMRGEGVERGRYGEVIPVVTEEGEPKRPIVERERFGMSPERGIIDASGAFWPEKSPEIETGAEESKRGERLARLKGAKEIWGRAKNFIKDKIPSVRWPKIKTPSASNTGKTAALVGVALVAVALIENCGGDSKPREAAMPGNTYGPNPPSGLMMDRPGLVTPPQVIESVTGEPFKEAVKPAPIEAGFGGGKGPATIEEDFTVAQGKQDVRGLVENQLAQMLNPEFKKVSDDLKAAKARGENVDYANATRDWAAGTVEDFKNKLKDQYGEARAEEIYDKFIKELSDQEKSVIVNYNQGAKVEPDGTITGVTDRMNLLDMGKEAEITFSMAVNGGYSSVRDGGILAPYQSSFRPGE